MTHRRKAEETYLGWTRGGYRNSETIDNGVILVYDENSGQVRFDEPHVVDVGKNIELLSDNNSLNQPLSPKKLKEGFNKAQEIFEVQSKGYSGYNVSKKSGDLAAQAVNTIRLARKKENNL